MRSASCLANGGARPPPQHTHGPISSLRPAAPRGAAGARARAGSPRCAPARLSRRARAVAVEAPAAAGAGEDEDLAEKELSATTYEDAGVTVRVTRAAGGGSYVVDVGASPPRPGAVLHWAVNDWELPADAHRPPGTAAAGDKAVQTPLGAGGAALRLEFPADGCPARVVFVIKDGERWTNAGGGDFAAYLKPPGADELVAKVLEAESSYEHWSLFNRFCLAAGLLDAADAAGPRGWALLLVWLRLSQQRQLDWYRNSNYQSKDAAHAQKTLAQRVSDYARGGAEAPLSRLLARMCMATLPRGGGNGDDIRMGILHIMRAHGIREGHRPGIDDPFLESWHQKLHTNTTPEDVTICEAYLAFLHSGSMDDFWRVAWDNGRVTRESLAGMDHPIDARPCHLPQLIDAMKGYLWTLKTTHAGADLDVAFEMARGHLPGDLAWAVGDVLAHRAEWWVPGKIAEVRRGLEAVWRGRHGLPRDVLLLDIALDEFFRLSVERADKAAMGGDDLVALAALVLENAAIAGECEPLAACAPLWRRLQAAAGEGGWTREWALAALAAADHTSLVLAERMDEIAALVQPHAEAFGAACGIDAAYIVNFAEEVVRGQPAFVLSPLLRELGPRLRAAAGVGAWQVVSRGAAGGGAAAGELRLLPDLSSIQGRDFAAPVVLLADALTGNEDIPGGVAAVLTAAPTDVLSHVAIRARSQGVLLASCFDAAEWEAMKALAGRAVGCVLTAAGDVVVAEGASAAAAGAGAGAGGAAAGGAPVRLAPAAKGAAAATWVVGEADFAEGVVGGKARNLAALRSKLPPWAAAPASIALPFGAFERALADAANAAVAAEVAAAEAELAAAPAGGGVPPALGRLRALVGARLAAPAGLAAAVGAAAEAAGLIPAGAWAAGDAAPGWRAAWAAIRAVWASKWNDRAWLSRRALRVPEADLLMSVLLQQIVPADYAFVLHTADPLTGAAGELHGELVEGMGEALVGNHPGRALAWRRTPAAGVELLALPSKLEALAAPAGGSLIARSDSNGEDLEEHAGAGLYDSVPLAPLAPRRVRYAESPLLWDGAARAALLERASELGAAVEAACGGAPQDVEGVVAGGEFFVVQARAQIVRN